VEDPGTYAVRGDIIDVFPPDRDTPARIELFDDVVERIRAFDPSSQRTHAELRELWVSPASEVILDHETTPGLRERVKQRADDQEIHRSLRDPVMSGIAPGLSPGHSDTWLPYCWKTQATVLDHIGPHLAVVALEPDSLLERYRMFREALERSAVRAPAKGLVVPEAGELYPVSSNDLERLLKQAGVVFGTALPGSRHECLSVSTESAATFRIRLAVTQPNPPPERILLYLLERGFKVAVFTTAQSAMEKLQHRLDAIRIPWVRSESTDWEGVVSRDRPGGGSRGDGRVLLVDGSLSEGFVWESGQLGLFLDHELTGGPSQKKKGGRAAPRKGETERPSSGAQEWAGLQALADLSVGDPVVHGDHGVGRYRGLVRLALNGAPSDFLQIEYEANDKLYVPVWRLNVIQKYSGPDGSAPLDRLGSQTFSRHKEKARESARTLAVDLVRLYAERTLRPGMSFSPPDEGYDRFENEFRFEETEDQLKAITAVLNDLQSGRPMDRLVCGDVGFGKTEVAMRAAFRTVTEGKQVAVLVPTTLLAAQHESSFRSRMEGHAISVQSITRFKSRNEQKKTLDDAATGKIDILIGTHRILSKDVRFKDLGLVVVDEEQRFGVEHKELLKTLRVNAHVLTLTATPIPRTLHLALSGLRDISLIHTAPVNRMPIRTYVARRDDDLIATAIRTELTRGGQVFFLHNRVQTINEIAVQLKRLVPEASFGVAHGQMSERELEDAMQAFLRKETQVFICTAIIESGLDIPSANTIIVDRADQFGLAQLYQIRGRVGRGEARAYAYLLLPAQGEITEDARKRLEVLQKFVELGSGFQIASHDLELRGGGDILGPDQSGHIAAVGYELYLELLDEAIRELRSSSGGLDRQQSMAREPEIMTPFPAFLPEALVPEVHQRLSLYRRLSAAKNEADVRALEEELKDRFGPLGAEALNLLWLIRIKILLKDHGVDALTVGDGKVTLLPGPTSRFDTDRIIALISTRSADHQLTPDSRLVCRMDTGALRALLLDLESLFERIVR
jgi:transcription-repair coupling factor (superfamily II helicase)